MATHVQGATRPGESRLRTRAHSQDAFRLVTEIQPRPEPSSRLGTASEEPALISGGGLRTVPGSRPGDSRARARALGASVAVPQERSKEG